MIDLLNSVVSGLGSILSGVLQVTVWLLALQGLFLGLMVLFYGRRSFWVLASVVGFVLGLWLASGFSANLPAWAQPVLALALGVAGAAVGFFAPRPVAAIIGSLVLALLGVALARGSGAALWLQWLIAIVLGSVGVYLFWRLLDWALIVGTSLFGAILAALSLTRLFGFARGLGILPFLLFLVVGIVYQARDRQMAAELKRLRSKLSPAPTDVTPAAPLLPTEQPAVQPPPADDAGAPVEVTDSPAIFESPASEPQPPAPDDAAASAADAADDIAA
jgi:hypothetical protein